MSDYIITSNGKAKVGDKVKIKTKDGKQFIGKIEYLSMSNNIIIDIKPNEMFGRNPKAIPHSEIKNITLMNENIQSLKKILGLLQQVNEAAKERPHKALQTALTNASRKVAKSMEKPKPQKQKPSLKNEAPTHQYGPLKKTKKNFISSKPIKNADMGGPLPDLTDTPSQSPVGQKAQQMGLHHVGFGHWADSHGRVIATTKKGKLVPVKAAKSSFTPAEASGHLQKLGYKKQPDMMSHLHRDPLNVYTNYKHKNGNSAWIGFNDKNPKDWSVHLSNGPDWDNMRKIHSIYPTKNDSLDNITNKHKELSGKNKLSGLSSNDAMEIGKLLRSKKMNSDYGE